MGGLNEQGKPAISWTEAQAWCDIHNQNPCDTVK